MKALLLALFLTPWIAHADVSVPRAKQYAWGVYDTAVSGGSSISHAINLSLPAGAVITDAWMYINTAFAATGSESLGVSCGGSQNIMAYQPVSALVINQVLSGRLGPAAPTGNAMLGPLAYSSATSYVGYGSVSTACGVTFDVKNSSGFTPYTAGKATLIVEYFRM